MDLIRLSQLISTTNLRSYRDDDFWIDRLSHRYSVVIFSLFAILVTTKAYIGDPIDCWAPPEFKASYERYAETLCFVNGTYYISSTEIDIPNEPNERYSNRIRYYQWTPFILLLQAFFMYLPRVIWLSLNTKYGIHLRNLVDAAKKYESVDSCSNREKIIAYLCRNLLRSVKYREYKANKRVLNAIKKDIYLNHQLELNSLLTLMSVHPALTTNVLNREPEPRLRKARAAKMANSRSFDDLNKLPSDTGNECRLRLVKFKNSPEPPKLRTSSKSSHNLAETSIYNPAYYIIDPKLDVNSLIEYLNNSIADGTKFQLESPVSLLHAKITNVSRKHLLGMFTAGCYQVDGALDDVEYAKPSNEQIAYLVNSDLMRQIDSSAAAARFEANSKRREEEKLLGKKKKKKCGLFNLADKYLSTLYVVVKFFYLLSALSQLVFLNRLIGNNFYILGITLIKTFFKEIEWPHLDVFPRMTLCEIYIREVGTTHPYLIQCVLRINIFNEIIFVCVWYWLLFVIGVTGLDLTRQLFYLFCSCSNCNRKLFALKYLELVHMNASFGQLASKRFAAKLRAKKKLDFDDLLAAKRSHQAKPTEHIGEPKTAKKFSTVKSTVSSERNNYYDNNMFLKVEKPQSRPQSMCSSDSYFEYQQANNNDELTGGNKTDWTHRSSSSKRLLNYLNHKYMLIVASEDEQFELFEHFCADNFNNDTIFSLRVIEQNVSSLIVSEIVEHLWTQYKAVHCVYSTESNDYLLKKLFVFNDLRQSVRKDPSKQSKRVPSTASSHKVLIEKL